MNTKIFYRLLMISILIIASQNGMAKESKYFTIANINLRISPNINSKSILMIPKATVINVIGEEKKKEKIDVFNKPWYKVIFSNKTGWVYGGYIIEYDGQDLMEFVKRYEFIRYFKDGKIWDYIDKRKNISYEIYLGFGQYNKNVNNDDLELNIQMNGERIFGFVIGKFEKDIDGYNLYCKEEYVEIEKGYAKKCKGKYAKKNDFITKAGVKNNKFIIYNIKEMIHDKNGKKFSSLELKGLLFEPSFTVNGYGGYNFN